MKHHPSKIWQYQTPDIDLSFTLAAGLNITPLVARLLVNRGIKTVDEGKVFLYPTYADLHSPFEMADMDKAVERIRRAIKNGEEIFVYGDYDADGTTATALLVNAFKHLDYPVRYYIPHRYEEGYGLNTDAVKAVKDRGCSLMITVDCGITSVREVACANELGIDVILTDHHQPPEDNPPPAYAIISPKVSGNEYPYSDLAGVGLAFKLAQGMIRDESFLTSLLDLVVLGTVVDLVPLTGENRILSRLGLAEINRQERIGIQKLCEVAGLNGKPLVGRSLSFGLGPRLNAAGRMDTALKVVKLLTTESSAIAEQIALELDQCNQDRKTVERTIHEKAVEILSRDENLEQTKGLVVASDAWGEQAKGVVGIVASRLLEQYYRPIFVLAIHGDEATGSGRCIDGMNLADCLNYCSKLLLKHGGHKAAAGITLKKANIPKFKKAFNAYATDHLTEDALTPKLTLDFETDLSSLSLETLEQFEILEPFGLENASPMFVCKDVTVQGEPMLMGSEKQHIKMYITDGCIQKKTIGWRRSQNYTTFRRPNIKMDIAFKPEINAYMGERSVQLILDEFNIQERSPNLLVYPPKDIESVGRVIDRRNQNKRDLLLSLLNARKPCIIYVLNSEKVHQLLTRLIPEKASLLRKHDETTSEQEEIALLEEIQKGHRVGIVSSGTLSKSALQRVPIVEHIAFCHLTSEQDMFFKRCLAVAYTQNATSIHLLYNEESDVQLLQNWANCSYPDRTRLTSFYRELRDTISTEFTQFESFSSAFVRNSDRLIETGLTIFEELTLIERRTEDGAGQQFVRLIPNQKSKLDRSKTFLKCQWLKQNSQDFQKFQLQENAQHIWERIKDECRIPDPSDPKR